MADTTRSATIGVNDPKRAERSDSRSEARRDGAQHAATAHHGPTPSVPGSAPRRGSMNGMRRLRPCSTRAAALAALSFGIGLLGGCTRSAPPATGAAAELAERLERADDPERFALRYSSGGTHVLDCVQPNRELTVSVDRTSDVLIVSASTEPERPAAMLLVADVYLSEELFASSALPAAWVLVPTEVDEATMERLTRLLGPPLAGYLFAGGLPANGAETATDVLRVAGEVTALGPGAGDGGEQLDGYRMRLDPDQLGDATGEDDDAPEPVAVAPLIDVWLDDDDEVARIEVRGDPQAGEDSSAESGWVTDYLPIDAPLDETPPSDVVELASIDQAGLAGAVGACALGASPG